MARVVSPVARPSLHPAPADTPARGAIVATAEELGQVVRWVRGERRVPMEDAAARSGVSRDLLRDLERAARGVNLAQTLDVLASFGIDVVLVPRDNALTLRDPSDLPGGVAAR
ncbi:MAG: helix-turn-helix domain-containing protein [Gemmatimonadaceae bacterium]|nr:helix-turn-helix domain-containing protein [Gemmatimonadaceae bacterium]